MQPHGRLELGLGDVSVCLVAIARAAILSSMCVTLRIASAASSIRYLALHCNTDSQDELDQLCWRRWRRWRWRRWRWRRWSRLRWRLRLRAPTSTLTTSAILATCKRLPNSQICFDLTPRSILRQRALDSSISNSRSLCQQLVQHLPHCLLGCCEAFGRL